MFKVVVLLSVIACALGAAVPVGMLPQLDGRIVGGEEIPIEDAPWQVSVQRYGSHFCGGSVYSYIHVVTAAHCLYTISSATALKVRAGSSEWNNGGVLLDVHSFKSHEGFNMYDMKNDIALLKLSSPLPNRATIAPIPLATLSPPSGASALVSGWGTTKSGSSSLPNVLRGVVVNIVTKDECSSPSYGYGSQVGETMICAYKVGKDSCQGDSGGPLASGGVLVGVVSWGYGCAYANYPGVYASVATLRGWVLDTAASL